MEGKSKKKATKDTYIDKSWHRRKKLTLKQEMFVNEIVKTGNATEAAARVYKTKNRVSANAIGNENLVKPSIKEAIVDRLKDAKNMIYTIAMTAEKDDTKLRACQDILDRAEWKAVAKIEHSGEIQSSIVYLPAREWQKS